MAALRRLSRYHLLLVLLALLALRNVVAWVHIAQSGGIHHDLANYLTFSYLGLHSGWQHLYDFEASKPIALATGAPLLPNQYPPYLMWLLVPLLYVPFPVAYGAWFGLMLMALLAAALLAVPVRGRAAWVLLMLAFLPVGFSFWLGQPVPLIVLSVVAAWRLLEARRDVLAGLALGVILFKPNIAVLVPVVLLAAWRWRALAGFAAVCVVAAVLALAVLTPAGVAVYFQHLSNVTAGDVSSVAGAGDSTLLAYLGRGPLLLAADLAVLLAVAWVAFATRSEGTSMAFAAALVGSLLVTTYSHWQDLVMLLPAGWLWVHCRPDPRLALGALTLLWLDANFPVGYPIIGSGFLALLAAEATWRWRARRIASETAFVAQEAPA